LAADLPAVFAAIRPMFERHAATGVVLHDQPGRYLLGTHEVRAKDGYRTWLGGVEIHKNYVSAYLLPVYAHPELLNGLDPQLRRKMQGKSCFNFKEVDPALFAELGSLIDVGVARFQKEGRLTADG
jgi:hypothetical protein